jgi:hypothetical protein
MINELNIYTEIGLSIVLLTFSIRLGISLYKV